jgi:hypothetical protein
MQVNRNAGQVAQAQDQQVGPPFLILTSRYLPFMLRYKPLPIQAKLTKSKLKMKTSRYIRPFLILTSRYLRPFGTDEARGREKPLPTPRPSPESMCARTLWPHDRLTCFLQNQRPAPPRLDLAKIAEIKERRSKVPPRTLDSVEEDDQLLLSPRLPPRQPTPLPPSSAPSSPVGDPPEILESEFDDSDDDYGTHQAREERAREKLASRGKQVPLRVEDEDEEDEQDFENEIGENGFEDDDERPKRTPKSKSKSASKPKRQTNPKSKERKKSKNENKNTEQGDADVDEPPKKRQNRREKKTKKGKGKANVVMTGDDADESAGEGDDVAGSHKTGPIPAATRKSAQKLFDTFLQDMQGLADDCKKPVSALHQAVGSSTMRAPRTTSGWNMWQQYHAEEHPKTPESKSRPASLFFSNVNGWYSDDHRIQ